MKKREISAQVISEFGVESTILELLKKYDSLEKLLTVNDIISDLNAAPKTGKLISEFFEITYDELLDKEDARSQEWVIKNLTDEL